MEGEKENPEFNEQKTQETIFSLEGELKKDPLYLTKEYLRKRGLLKFFLEELESEKKEFAFCV